MEVIHLQKKTIIELNINGEEFVATLDHYAIDHFQKHNKIGLLKFYENMSNNEDGSINLTQVVQLLGSLVRYKKNGRIVGAKYFEQFDTMQVVQLLTPILSKILGNNLPESSNDAEKK